MKALEISTTEKTELTTPTGVKYTVTYEREFLETKIMLNRNLKYCSFQGVITDLTYLHTNANAFDRYCKSVGE